MEARQRTRVFYQATPAVGADGRNIMKLIPIKIVNGQKSSVPVTETGAVTQDLSRGTVSAANVVPGQMRSARLDSVNKRPPRAAPPTRPSHQLPVMVSSPALPRGQFLKIPPNAQVQRVPVSQLPPLIKDQIFTSSSSSSTPTVVYVSPVTTMNQAVPEPSRINPTPSLKLPSSPDLPRGAEPHLKLVPKVSERPSSPIRWEIEEVEGRAAETTSPLSSPSGAPRAAGGAENALVMYEGRVFFVAQNNGSSSAAPRSRHPAVTQTGQNPRVQNHSNDVIDLCDDDEEPAPSSETSPVSHQDEENVIFVSYIPPRSDSGSRQAAARRSSCQADVPVLGGGGLGQNMSISKVTDVHAPTEMNVSSTQSLFSISDLQLDSMVRDTETGRPAGHVVRDTETGRPAGHLVRDTETGRPAGHLVRDTETGRPAGHVVRDTETGRPAGHLVRDTETGRPAGHVVRDTETGRPAGHLVRDTETGRPAGHVVRDTETGRPAGHVVRDTETGRPAGHVVRDTETGRPAAQTLQDSRLSAPHWTSPPAPEPELCPRSDQQLRRIFGITSDVKVFLQKLDEAAAERLLEDNRKATKRLKENKTTREKLNGTGRGLSAPLHTKTGPLDSLNFHSKPQESFWTGQRSSEKGYVEPIDEDFPDESVRSEGTTHRLQVQTCVDVSRKTRRVGRTRRRTMCPCCIPAALHPVLKSGVSLEQLEAWMFITEETGKRVGKAKASRKDGRTSVKISYQNCQIHEAAGLSSTSTDKFSGHKETGRLKGLQGVKET
nr:N-acylglucosamine 2-epimerase isoform X1 [Nothobranchius furzeri]